MARVICVMTEGLSCDVRELIVQRGDMAAAHSALARPRPDEWYAAYVVDEILAKPEPTEILVVDDVLTAGAHYAGLKRRLLSRFPAARLYGMFYARRAVQEEANEAGDPTAPCPG